MTEAIFSPALILDLDALDANVATAFSMARASGLSLRPHAKSHKCSAIARQLSEAGSVGACVATLWEAEALVSGGVRGILVTAPQGTADQFARIAALAAASDIMVVVDEPSTLPALARAVDSRGAKLRVLIDCDVGQGRTGVAGAQQAVALASAIGAQAALEYMGLQGYWGHLQQVSRFEERRSRVEEQADRLRAIVEALAVAGFPSAIITGGGTGTLAIDLDLGLFTELQPGSFLFLDSCYGPLAIKADENPFRHALCVWAHVVSAVTPQRIIINAGLKAFATDSGHPVVVEGAPAGTVYRFMGDEHGCLDVPGGGTLPVGAKIALYPSHCDPTVNLYDRYHLVRDGKPCGSWPIIGRGYGEIP